MWSFTGRPRAITVATGPLTWKVGSCQSQWLCSATSPRNNRKVPQEGPDMSLEQTLMQYMGQGQESAFSRLGWEGPVENLGWAWASQ